MATHSSSEPRDCGICDYFHPCHCPRLQAVCRVCCPEAFAPVGQAEQSEYAKRRGEPAPKPARVPLIGRLVS